MINEDSNNLVPEWLQVLRKLGVKPGIQMTASTDDVGRTVLDRATTKTFSHPITPVNYRYQVWCEVEAKIERGDRAHPQGLGAMARICTVNRKEKENGGRLDRSDFLRCHCDRVITSPTLKAEMVGKDFRGVRLNFERLRNTDPVLHWVFETAVAMESAASSWTRHTAFSLYEKDLKAMNASLGDGPRVEEGFRQAASWEDRTARLRKAYDRLAHAKNINEWRRRVVLIAEEVSTRKIAAWEIPDFAEGYVEYWLAQGQDFFMFRCLE